MENIKRITDDHGYTHIPGDFVELSESGKAAMFILVNGASGFNSTHVWVPVSQMAVFVNGAFEIPVVKSWLARKNGW